jgi:Mg-chelatase subunit ChlD
MTSLLQSLPVCPITGEIMKEPVTTPDGNTYEKEAILQWLHNHNTEPQTRNILSANQLVPNRALKVLYENYMSTININDTNMDSFEIERIPLTLNATILKTNETKFDILVNIESKESDDEDFQDIILCLDNSGSMGNSADKKGSGENTGLTILDILKHGVKTIINTSNSKQRIGIVSFSDEGVIRCPLTTANESGKQQLIRSLDLINPDGMTNLYDGIIKSWSLLESRDMKNRKSTVIVFTDGEPNQNPPRGYIPQLKMLKDRNGGKYISDINIYTFGNNVNSTLSDEITRETGGTYGYMPDSSFIGDLLEHKVASIRTCRAKKAVLDIQIEDLKEFNISEGLEYVKTSNNSIQIIVGDILYGQDRNFVISFELKTNNNPQFIASLDYNEDNTDTFLNIQTETFTHTSDYSELIYNKTRHELVKTISYMINYIDCNDYNSARAELYMFISNIPTINDERLTKMNEDLKGQIALAIDTMYYNVWGRHYLLSLRRAYQIEQCNNFKDFGIQHFGSKLFQKILNDADDIFTTMPPPKPSRTRYSSSNTYSIPQQPVDMTSFNSRYNNSCFHGSSLVKMKGDPYKIVSNISKGDFVTLANGKISKVECVVKTVFEYNYNDLLTINDSLHLTPYHPIKINGKWCFPNDIPSSKQSDLDCDAIYSFILEDRGNGSGMLIGDIECATLGHGITGDITISHPFFGTEEVINNLKLSPEYSNGLVILKENSLIRDSNTGLVCRIIL